jgi:hypothetical protein
MPIRLNTIAAVVALWVAAVGAADAQTFATDRGVWQVGGNVNLGRAQTSGSGPGAPTDASTAASLAPRLGYFVLPGLAVTGNLSLGYSNSDLGHQWGWGVGPGLTYYFGRGAKKLYPYVAGVTLFQWSRGYRDGTDGPIVKSDARRWQLSGGAVLLVARNVGLNGELYFSRAHLNTSIGSPGSPSFESSSTLEDYGLQFGVSLFVY